MHVREFTIREQEHKMYEHKIFAVFFIWYVTYIYHAKKIHAGMYRKKRSRPIADNKGIQLAARVFEKNISKIYDEKSHGELEEGCTWSS